MPPLHLRIRVHRRCVAYHLYGIVRIGPEPDLAPMRQTSTPAVFWPLALPPKQRRCSPMPGTLLLLCFVVAAHNTTAQTTFRCSAISVVVNNGTHLVVEGDVLLNTGALFNNNGIVHVEGEWDNSSGGAATTTTSTGSVVLYGGAQDISGADITDFRNLEISGGDKTLLVDAHAGRAAAANGTLNLNGAILRLNGHSFTVYNPASSAVVDNGGSVRSESPDLLSRFVWALGNDVGAHVVPFSNATGAILPFSFTPGAAFPDNTLLTVATYPSAPDNTPYPATTNETVLHMAGVTVADNSANTVDRFWLTDLPNASFTGTLLLSHAPADDASLGVGPVRAQRWLETAGTWQPPIPGQTNPFLRQVQVPAVPFSDVINPADEHIWAMAYNATPLPVELIAFNAVAVDNSFTRCTWATASEHNNDFFTVERSHDAISFEPVGNVAGAGHSNTVLRYNFDDPAPHPGTSYYRLRQTDLDGTVSYTSPIPVTFTSSVSITLFPNPNNGALTIQRTDSSARLPLQLVDASGRVVRKWELQEGEGRLQTNLDIAPGYYSMVWPDGHLNLIIER